MALGAYCYTEHVLQGWAQISAERTEGARMAARAVELAWRWQRAVDERLCDLALRHGTSQAKELANRSLAINPNSAIALTTLAWIETCDANPTKGLELFRRAERLSPRDPRGWFISTGLSAAHYYEGRLDEAALWARKALIHNSGFAIALRFLAASLAK